MNTPILIAVVVTMFVCQQVHAQDEDVPQFAQETDLELMQGTWEVVSVVFRGEQKEVSGNLWRFEGNRKYIWIDDRTEWFLAYPFTVDPSAMPAEMDVDSLFGSLLGIYEIDGDTLTLCLGMRGTFEPGTRPDRFESTKGSRSFLYVLRRVEDDE